MGINAKTIFYVVLLTVLVLVPQLYATRTFNTAVYNGQKYTAPTTTTPKSRTNNAVNAAAAAAAAASRRYHPPPAGANRYSQPTQRPLFKPPTTTPAVKCKCNCQMGWQPICAKDFSTNEVDTFPTKCQLDCYNCTHNKRFVVISNSECP